MLIDTFCMVQRLVWELPTLVVTGALSPGKERILIWELLSVGTSAARSVGTPYQEIEHLSSPKSVAPRSAVGDETTRWVYP